MTHGWSLRPRLTTLFLNPILVGGGGGGGSKITPPPPTIKMRRVKNWGGPKARSDF